jgi:hypothetical protein
MLGFILAAVGYTYQGDGLINFCANIFYRISTFWSGLKRITFMVFLLLKLRATSFTGKPGIVEKISIVLTVVAFICLIVNVSTVRGIPLPQFGARICLSSQLQLVHH